MVRQGARHLDHKKISVDTPWVGAATAKKKKTRFSLGGAAKRFLSFRRLARHAVQLLKVGGVLVYSTCTVSPLENENVVAQALDVPKMLPS